MILILKILLHNVHKIIILWYPTYVYQFLIFLIITKIECWPVFKQDPRYVVYLRYASLPAIVDVGEEGLKVKPAPGSPAAVHFHVYHPVVVPEP